MSFLYLEQQKIGSQCRPYLNCIANINAGNVPISYKI